MDKRSDKKIGYFLVMWAVLVILGGGCYLLLHQAQKKVADHQAQEMIVMHPNQEQEIIDSFSFYQEQSTWDGRRILSVYLVGITVVIAGLYVIQNASLKPAHSAAKYRMKKVLVQLEQFQKGNYQVEPIDMEQFVNQEDTQLWTRIWEQLMNLGFYFEQMREQLAVEENNTKSLVSDISHQLKTPLASLRMSHELLQGDGLTIEEREEFFQKEEAEISRLEVLLQELVNLSRLESHMIQIEPELSGIKKTITEAVNVVIMKALAKNIEVQVSIHEDIEVRHDGKWTVEAIANVLDNAIKYSAENTCITISVNYLPNLLLIEIEDEGIGINAEEIHKIFQRFYRGKEAARYTKDGAGIGLYLTRRIIEQQGGTIVAKRKQEHGTIFKITFPLDR